MTITRIHDSVEKAQEMALPAETIFAAMAFASFEEAPAHLARLPLGNGSVLELALTRLPEVPAVLVSIVGIGAYPFAEDGSLLHYSYVREKFRGLTDCDAVGLTCLIGVALQRPVGVDGACGCPRHGDEG